MPDQKPLPLEQCGLALSWTLAVFGGWAWLMSAGLWTGELTAKSPGFVLLAALSVVLQIASNYSAAAARRARALELTESFNWAVRLMIAGGAYNAFSLHHAWMATGLIPELFPLTVESMAANAPILFLSLVLAFFEPALYWIDEALKGEFAARAAMAALAVNGLPHGAPELRQFVRHETPRVEQLERVFGAPQERASAPRGAPPRARKARATTQDGARQKAQHMLMAGALSRRQIAEKTGLSPSTINRMAKAMTPLEGAMA